MNPKYRVEEYQEGFMPQIKFPIMEWWPWINLSTTFFEDRKQAREIIKLHKASGMGLEQLGVRVFQKETQTNNA